MGNCSCKYIFLKVMLEAASLFLPPKPLGLTGTGMTVGAGQRGCEGRCCEREQDGVCRKQRGDRGLVSRCVGTRQSARSCDRVCTRVKPCVRERAAAVPVSETAAGCQESTARASAGKGAVREPGGKRDVLYRPRWQGRHLPHRLTGRRW